MIAEPNEEAIPESQVQEQNGKEHVRTIDPINTQLLIEILAELKNMNTQLSLITDEEL